jgi:A/G-specific adenine glycosylase
MSGRSRAVSRETLTPRQLRTIRRNLLDWYDRHKRDLPWRRRGDDPYAQLLAEFMLQQTQVATVIPYYERFFSRFPTVRVLAEAPQDDVLALWSGLGYYSRARNLHTAARMIVERFGGQVPRTVDELLTLPGIGRYTAGAIASVAFDTRAPILDGNVTRVLMRLLAMDADPKAPATRDALWEVAEAVLPLERCGDFNQALMELGATVCTPKNPDCPGCPVRRICAARACGREGEIPPVARRVRVQAAEWVTAAVRAGEAWLFVQRPPTGLWASLWELPSEPLADGEPLEAAWNRLAARLPDGCMLEPTSQPPVTRQLTHRRLTFHPFRGTAGTRRPGTGHRWVHPDELSTLGISNATRAILASLGGPRPRRQRASGV